MHPDDIHAITTLCNTYVFHADAGQFDEIGKMFEEGTMVVAGTIGTEPVKGREAVRDFYVDQVVLHDGEPRTRHLITSLTIDVTADRASATARSYFTVLQGLSEEPIRILVSGRYLDRFRREESTWRFVEKQIVGDYVGDLSSHFQPTSRYLKPAA